jgi:hypothetical protein
LVWAGGHSGGVEWRVPGLRVGLVVTRK